MSQNVPPEKDSMLAFALASGTSISDVAAQNDMDRKTIHRKLENPEFRRLVAEFRDRLIGAALGRMTDAMTRGADELTRLLDSPEPHIKLRAIRLLFTLGIRLRDSIDLATSMREVQDELARMQGVER